MKSPNRTAPQRIARALVAALMAAPAAGLAGEAPVARLVQMNGSVLVSRDISTSSVFEGERVFPGARVLTTARADVVVEFNDGCRVQLEPGERFQVGSASPCASTGLTPALPGDRTFKG